MEASGRPGFDDVLWSKASRAPECVTHSAHPLGRVDKRADSPQVAGGVSQLRAGRRGRRSFFVCVSVKAFPVGLPSGPWREG